MKKMMTCIILLICLIPSVNAAAEVSITAEYGLQGQGKFDRPIAVTLTLQNDETPFEGELVTTYPANYMLQTGQVISLKLAPHEKLIKQFYMGSYPYELYSDNEKRFVQLYEGSVENGKKVEHFQFENRKPNLFEYETHVVGVFSYPQVAQALQKLRTIEKGRLLEVETYPLMTADLVTDIRSIDFINTIVLTDPLKMIEQDQFDILIEWMKQGGQLVVQEDVTFTPLASYAALQATGGTSEISPTQLTDFTGEGKFTNPMSIRTSELMPKAQAIEVNGQLIAAKQKVGSGMLIQTAFSLTDSTLIEIDGFANLFAKLIDFQNKEMYKSSIDDEIVNQVVPVNELFPAFQFSTWIIISVFALYILIISPVIYFLLKRKDKREHAWWIIPTISFVFSIMLFLVGARDRLAQPQIQQSAVIKIGNEIDQQYFTQSLLTNKRGDYTFELANGIEATAYNSRMSNRTDFQKGQWSYVKQNEFVMKNVAYWDVETIVGKGPIEVGQFKLNMTNDNGILTGTITNELQIDVTDVQLWTGTNFISIGNLKQGEKRKIEEKVPTTLLLPVAQPIMDYTAPTPETIDKVWKDRLNALAYSTLSTEDAPAIIASANNVPLGAILSQKAQVTSNVLIVQPIHDVFTNLSDEITLTNEAFNMSYSETLYGGIKEQFNSSMQDVYLAPGTYDVSYRLSLPIQNMAMDWSSLHYKTEHPIMRATIYNVETEQFEPVNTNFSTENVQSYLNDGEIIVQWEVSEGGNLELLNLPEITLKGGRQQ
ncbi:hypothetical protein [Solibacillus cecembensis]|uniref:hypothetical protein n=1 Tax=Solibacillus cecembensis TaxID=459347 RepID=UPI003D064A23